jgi:hypothetical protein
MKSKVIAVKRSPAQAHVVPQTAEAVAVRLELSAKLQTALLIGRLQRCA